METTREVHTHANDTRLATTRHLYTTTLANAGIPTHLIDAVTGHAAVGSTSRVIYTHITPEALATIPPVIEAAWQRT